MIPRLPLRLPGSPRLRAALGAGGLVLLTLALTQFAVPSGTGVGRGAPVAVDFSGLLQGAISGLIAAGLVLVFRTNRIINFSAVALGVPACAFAFELIRFTTVPLPVDLLAAVVLSAGIGALAELVFVRRFLTRSRLLVTILTIALLSVLGELIPLFENLPVLPPADQRPQSLLLGFDALRPYLPLAGLHFRLGSFPETFGFPELFTIECTVTALVALVAFLRYSRIGVALRSVAQNPERSALLGISVGSVSTLSWALAGALAGLAGLLQGITASAGVVIGSVSPLDLLTPLTAAVLARFRSIPAALGYSLLLQVLAAAVGYATANSEPVILGGQLLILLAGLLAQRRGLLRLADTEEGSGILAAAPRPVPRQMRGLTGVRLTPVLALAAAALVLLLVPFLANPGTQNAFQLVFLVAIAGLSIVVLTGWAGQISLGQYAFLGIGAVVAGGASDRGGLPFPVSVLLGVLAAAGLAVLVGLPALRVRGVYLGAVTFALAAAVSSTLFDPTFFGWLLPAEVTRPVLFGVPTDSERIFYFVCLVALVAALAFVGYLRRSRIGRLFIASRDNSAALSATGVSAVRTKLLAFAISGGLAGFAGALLAYQQRGVQQATFGVPESLNLFFYVVVGGVATVAGALIGVALLEAVAHLPANPVVDLIAGTITTAVIFIFPGGLLQAWTRLRDTVLRIIAQRSGLVVPALYSDVDAAALTSRLIPLGSSQPGGGAANLPAGLDYRGSSRLHGRAGVVRAARAAQHESATLAAPVPVGVAANGAGAASGQQIEQGALR